MYRQSDVSLMAILLVLASLLLCWYALAGAQNQTLTVPRPTPTPVLLAPLMGHYRCELAKDGTTVTLMPIEDGMMRWRFSCLNCECGVSK